MKVRYSSILRWLGLALGLGLVGLLLSRLDLGATFQSLNRLGWGIFAIFSLTLPKFWLYAWSWGRVLRHLGEPIKIGTLFRLKLIGEAVAEATPLNFLGGDPLRILLLKAHLPWQKGTQSVVVDRLAHMVSGALMILLGGGLFILRYRAVSFSMMHQGFEVLLILFLLTTVSIVVGFRMRSKIPREILRMKQVLLAAIFITFLGRLFSVLEIYWIGLFLQVPLGAGDALILSALSLGLHTVFGFIPSGLGVIEGGFVGYFSWIGRSMEEGLAVSLVRRVNGLLWILVGVVMLGVMKRQDRPVVEAASE